MIGSKYIPGVISIFLPLFLCSGVAVAQDLSPEEAVVLGGTQDRLEALVTLCQSESFEELRFALFDPAPVVRQIAVACWDQSESYGPELMMLLGDPDGSVRLALAETLGRSSWSGRDAALEELTTDSDDTVRGVAISYLTDMAPSEAVTLLRSALADSSLEVQAAAARVLERAGAGHLLSETERESYQFGLSVAALSDEQPELGGLLLSSDARLHQVEQMLLSMGADALGCQEETLSSAAAARDQLRALAPTADFEQLLNFGEIIDSVAGSYHICLASQPLSFGTGPSLDFAGQRILVLTAELSTLWDVNFGVMRDDLEHEPDGGEFWSRSLLGLNLFLPARQEMAPPNREYPSVALVAQAGRDQLFREEQLSIWSGAAGIRGHLPLGCSTPESCVLHLTAFGQVSPGFEEGFPLMLVAAHQSMGADAAFEYTPLEGVLATLTVGVSRLRYDAEVFAPAGLDQGFVSLTIDSPFQLSLSATRNQYAELGPIDVDNLVGDAQLRDGEILDGKIGIRIGNIGLDEIMRIELLGGVGIPILDDFDQDIDPQVTFQAMMTTGAEDIRDNVFGYLQLGGSRQVEPSPYDFALQAVIHSFLRVVFRSAEPPESGVNLLIQVEHFYTEHLGPLTSLRHHDVNTIGGGFNVRFLVEEWFGFDIANRTTGRTDGNADFEVNNRFTFSMFIPFGGYGFDIEEPFPW